MLRTVLLIVVLAIFKKVDCVAEYGDCTSGAKCDGGLNCYAQSDYYSQCLKACPSGWKCSSGGSAPTTSKPAAVTTGKPSAPSAGGKALTNDCTFGFGAAFDGNSRDYSQVDYATIWIGTISPKFGTNFNKYWHGDFLRKMVSLNKLPVYYGYIIAFMARHEAGLQDCDVGTPSLCQRGSKFIRDNRQNIVNKYSHYAQETAAIVGAQSRMVWLIEMDFWQYYGDSHQEGGALSGEYMRALFDDIVRAIKQHLPNARTSWDISPWIGEAAMKKWWGYFASSPIDFIHTSGGNARGDLAQIKPNEVTYKFMSQTTGKKILADTGYGVAGGSTGHNTAWDSAANLRQRESDGVISVVQANLVVIGEVQFVHSNRPYQKFAKVSIKK